MSADVITVTHGGCRTVVLFVRTTVRTRVSSSAAEGMTAINWPATFFDGRRNWANPHYAR